MLHTNLKETYDFGDFHFRSLNMHLVKVSPYQRSACHAVHHFAVRVLSTVDNASVDTGILAARRESMALKRSSERYWKRHRIDVKRSAGVTEAQQQKRGLK